MGLSFSYEFIFYFFLSTLYRSIFLTFFSFLANFFYPRFFFTFLAKFKKKKCSIIDNPCKLIKNKTKMKVIYNVSN